MKSPPPENMTIHDLPEMVFVTSLESENILWCNNTMEYRLGYSLAEMKDLKGDFFKEFIHPQDYPNALNIKNHFLAGATEYNNYYRIRPKNSIHWSWHYSVAKVYERDKEGLPQSLIYTLIKLDKRQTVEKVVKAYKAIKRRSIEPPAFLMTSMTPAERRILPYLAAGISDQRIAEGLYVSKGTVKTHIKHIMHKLKVHTRIKLVVLLKDYGY